MNKHISSKQRTAIFANYDSDNIIQDYVIYYLKKLKEVAKTIIFVSDCEYSQKELKKIKKYVSHTICKKHGEYDFGSYKRGYLYAKDNGLLKNCEELILCNDSCYAPIYPFQNMFLIMSSKDNIDFWGCTMNAEGYIKTENNKYKGGGYIPHIQSYFIVLKKNIINSDIFANFMISIKKEKMKKAIIYKYEEGLTKALEEKGYKWDIYCKSSKFLKNSQVCYFKNLIKNDCSPCLKTSICRYQNKDLNIYPDEIYSYIKNKTKYNIGLIYKDLKNKKIIQNISKRELIKNEQIRVNAYEKSKSTIFLEKIFSIKNSKNKKHKIINIAGIKLKIKRHKNNKVVYTCITGNYDCLKNHTFINNNWDYVCYSDNRELLKQKKIGIWQIRPLKYNKLDNTKNARWHKMHPHILFPDYNESLWIDANFNIKTSYIFKLIELKSSSIIVPLHFQNQCVFEEAAFVLECEKENEKIIEKATNFLKKKNMPTKYGLNETNIIYRKHHDKKIKKLMDMWFNCIEKISKRDQLFFSYVLWKNNIKLEDISIPNARFDKNNFSYVEHKENVAV